MTKHLARAEVAPEQTWKLDDLFDTREAWLAETTAIEHALKTVTAQQHHLTEGADRLLAFLDAHDAPARLRPAYMFSSLRNSENGGDAAQSRVLRPPLACEAGAFMHQD